ncbi:hypothetical protein A2U01_0057612, partial [Trifolium medium]|nr:hypothetical protein [Trifolium medium]
VDAQAISDRPPSQLATTRAEWSDRPRILPTPNEDLGER